MSLHRQTYLLASNLPWLTNTDRLLGSPTNVDRRWLCAPTTPRSTTRRKLSSTIPVTMAVQLLFEGEKHKKIWDLKKPKHWLCKKSEIWRGRNIDCVCCYVCVFYCVCRSPWMSPPVKEGSEEANPLLPVLLLHRRRHVIPHATSDGGTWANAPPVLLHCLQYQQCSQDGVFYNFRCDMFV